jgi:hypothetical protein
MRKNGNHKSPKAPAFAARAERAMRRATRKVRAENRALGLPIIVWENGKVVKKPA